MTPQEFHAWRERHGMTQAAAAEALGLAVSIDGRSSDAVRHYEKGRRQIPRSIALLCRYIDRFGVIG